MTANTTPRVDVTKALAARQDAHDVARLLADDGFPERSAFIINTLTLLDTCIIQLERELAAIRAETREECARVCEKRAELRWEENGYTEPDTNASYYPNSHAWCETADEEANDCAAAIRALPDAKGQTKAAHVVQTMDANGKWPSENQPMTVTTTAGTAPANDEQPRYDYASAVAYAKKMGLPIEFPEPAGTAPGREEPKHWKVFCALCKSEWSVPYQHPGKSICEDCENKHNYLAADLERVKGERDDAVKRMQQGWIRVTDSVLPSVLERATTAEASVEQMREQYDELIMAVARKHQNETRHQTALRYIRQAEEGSNQTGQASAASENSGGSHE